LRRPTLDDAFLALTGRPASTDGTDGADGTGDDIDHELAEVAS
jgi:hypothetical protein